MRRGRKANVKKDESQPAIGRLMPDKALPPDAEVIQRRNVAKTGFRRNNILGSGHAQSLMGAILGADEMEQQSVCNLADTADDPTCLSDLRMGPSDFEQTCATCFCKYASCGGHFGIIKIPEDSWFAHPFYVEDGTIAAIMNLFCFTCFKKQWDKRYGTDLPAPVILFSPMEIEKYTKKYVQIPFLTRLKILAEKAMPMACTGNCKSSYFKGTPELEIVEVMGKDSVSEVNVITMYHYLKSISDYIEKFDIIADFIGFGKVRFDNLIVQLIPVIPPKNRPPVIIMDRVNKSDFTLLYETILVIVKKMNQSAGNEQVMTDLRKSLRDAYYTYINSDAKSITKGKGKSGDTWKTLVKILNSKKGLVHKNIWSSRVDNSGRTVITGDNSIKPNEVRIPRFMAEKFRIKLAVTETNRELCKSLIRKDIVKLVIRNPDGIPRLLPVNDENRERLAEELKVGDRCDRRMVTGDVVIVNRQPTLHRWSIPAMKAVVHEQPLYGDPTKEVYAIGMNTAYVSGFNADFDGDEVHLHVPSSLDARAEAAALMGVEKAPVSDQTSKNIFGLIQNTVWGAYEMTKNPQNMSKGEWQQFAAQANDFEAPLGTEEPDFSVFVRARYIEEQVPRRYSRPEYRDKVRGLGIWNTRTLLSMAFPPDFSYVKHVEGEDDIIIDKGILICGILTKSIVGAGYKSLIQTIFEEFGPTQMVVFTHVMQQVVGEWMEGQGLTISLTDFAPDEELEDKMERLKDEKLRNAEMVGQRNVHGIFDQDELLNKLRRWISIPVHLKQYITEQTLGRLRNEIVFNLFKVIHVEVNLYKKGRSELLFDPVNVTSSLRRSIGLIITPAGGINRAAIKLTLVQQSLLPEDTENKTERLDELKEIILDQINVNTIDFVNDQVLNPLDPDTISTKSAIEKAHLEAGTLDALDEIRGAGQKLLLDESKSSRTILSKLLKVDEAKEMKGKSTQQINEYRKKRFEDIVASINAFMQDVSSGVMAYDYQLAGSIERARQDHYNLDAIRYVAIMLLRENSNRTTSVNDMIASGARGDKPNLTKSKFALGDSTMSGGRLKEAISGGTRVTPFFLENDPDPAARGYVRNSYFRGMNPTEFFAAAMPARQTQTDTAFKTGETGYMQKKLMAVAGDFIVYSDGSVRNERGEVVTYLYGGHSFDPSRMVRQDNDFFFVDVKQLAVQVNAEVESKIKTRKEYFQKF